MNGCTRQRSPGTSDADLIRYIGMECFVAYFDLFNDWTLRNRDVAGVIRRDRRCTWKSCQSRTSKSRRIIRAGRATNVLENIITSDRVSNQTRNKAARVLNRGGTVTHQT